MKAIDRFATDPLSTGAEAFAWGEYDWGDGAAEILSLEALVWRPNDGLAAPDDDFGWLDPAAPGDGIDRHYAPFGGVARREGDGVDRGHLWGAAQGLGGLFDVADGVDRAEGWRTAGPNAIDAADGIDDGRDPGGARDASFDGGDWREDLSYAVPPDGFDSVALPDGDGAPTSA